MLPTYFWKKAQNNTKRNDYEKNKKSHAAGVEPETFGV